MSGSDDEELAALRRARAQKLVSGAGLTVTAQRNRILQQPAAGRRDEGDEDGPVVVHTEQAPAAAGPIPPHPSFDHNSDDEELDEDDGIPAEWRAHLPSSFGVDKSAKAAAQAQQQRQAQQEAAAALKRDATADADGGDVGPSRPREDQEADDEEDEDLVGPVAPAMEDVWELPISSEIALKGHERAVTAFDIDHAGNRMITGSMDYTVKLYDFNGMKSDFRPFRSFEPCEGHPVNALSWSPNGEAFLVVTGSPQPKVYDRDGKEQGEMVRGDMYIRDMKNTKGHVSGCTGGQWHPTDRGTGMTCSEDGTVRIWDLWTLEQKTVIKPTLAKPGRVGVTACAYSSDGKLAGAGLMDGTLQIWDVKGKVGHSAAVGVVPHAKQQMVAKQTWSFVSGSNQVVRGAHASGSEITCLRFSRDGRTLISRGADETLKIWDLRQFKKPLAVAENLPTTYGTTQCCFSPDEKLIVTGISATSAATNGGLVFLDRSDLSMVRRLGMPGSAITVQWHPKINQIFTGCGDRKLGETRVLFDPGRSTRGALLCVSRKPRAADPSDFVAVAEPEIFNPNALPMYRQQWPGKGKRKQEAEAGVRTSKSFKPDVGSAGTAAAKGAGGKLGATGGTLLTQYVLKHHGKLKNPKDEDIRASILRHEGKTDDFSRFTEAYKATQPTRIYAEEEGEEQEGEDVGPKPPGAT